MKLYVLILLCLICFLFGGRIAYGQEVSGSLKNPAVKVMPLHNTTEGYSEESTTMRTIRRFYEKSTILYRLVLYINLFFILSSIVLSSIVISRRLFKLGINPRIVKYREKYRNIIVEWIYEEQKESVVKELIRESRHKLNREIFTSELLSLHSNLSGESADKLANLFDRTGLKRYSIKKIKSCLWNRKATGFRELSQMNITSANNLIYKYLNSNNEVLRLEAQLAWVKLNPENPDGFYDFQNIQISKWGQLNVLAAFEKTGSRPDFSKWLVNSNKEITLFALKMAGIFKQFEVADLVIDLLNDNDCEIRKEAICTLGKLEAGESVGDLQTIFNNEINSNKKEILKSLIAIKDMSNISFFKQVLFEEADVSLRILSVKGLLLSGNEGDIYVNDVYDKADPLLINIINHTKCEMLYDL